MSNKLKTLFNDDESSFNDYDIEEQDLQNQEEDKNKMKEASKFLKKKRNKKEDLQERLGKYKGKVYKKDEIQDESEDIEDDVNHSENESIDDTILKPLPIEDDDNSHDGNNAKVNRDEDLIKAQHVLSQQDIFYSLAGLRIMLQEIMQISNKLPQSTNFNLFNNETTLELIEKVNEKAVSVIEVYSQLIDKLIKKINKKTLNKAYSKYKTGGDDKNCVKYCKKIISMWYKQTIQQAFRANSKNVNVNNQDDYTDTIDENIKSYYDGFRSKTKRVKDKILGLNLKGKSLTENEEVFNDIELYDNILKDFIQYNQDDTQPNTDDSNFANTALFLQNRREKTKKLTNTKASKNRKLRYDKHEKITNFMIPEENLNVFEGRDEFLKKLFGKCNSNIESKVKEITKKTKQDIRII